MKLRFISQNILLLSILCLALFLSLYNFPNTMVFIGDQGWFYLSARDILLTGKIPLVGITSSHTWLHQGPLWTYTLTAILSLFHFNPLSGAYFTIVINLISINLLYHLGAIMFNRRASLIAAFLYATSPFIISTSIMPYHTNPIPIFTIIFLYSLYQWIHGKNIFFPISILCLTLLYNFELATVSLWFVFFLVVGYGIWKKMLWVKNIQNKTIIFLSLIAFVVPMAPVLLYDVSHGFPQTVKFAAWMVYHVLHALGFPAIHADVSSTTWFDFLQFSFRHYQLLLFAQNAIVAVLLFFVSFVWYISLFYSYIMKKKDSLNYILFGLYVFITLAGYISSKTTSEAYLPMLFPAMVMLIALVFDRFMRGRLFTAFALFGVLAIGISNIYFIIKNDSMVGKQGYGISFTARFEAATSIVHQSLNQQYNLIGKGKGSQYQSFTMNYEYLAWYLGHGPSHSPQSLHFIITENQNSVTVKRE